MSSEEYRADPTAATDQRREDAKNVARLVAAFYGQLVEERVDEHTVSQATLEWARRIMARKG